MADFPSTTLVQKTFSFGIRIELKVYFLIVFLYFAHKSSKLHTVWWGRRRRGKGQIYSHSSSVLHLSLLEFHAKQTKVNEKKFFAKKAPNHQHEHIKLLCSIFIFFERRAIVPLFSLWKLNSESEIKIETDARGCGISADYIIIAAAKSQWIRNDVSLSLLPRHESEV